MSCGSCQRNVVNTVAHGAVGLAKVAVNALGGHIDQATTDVIKQRWNICRDCEQSTKSEKYLNHECKGLTSFSFCKECKCNIRAKTSLKSESCPLKKW